MPGEFIKSSLRQPFEQIKSLLDTARTEILIIAPYVKSDVVTQLLPDKKLPTTIVTSWKIKDFLFGVSDIDLYPLCQELGINLYLNNRIHLKVYVADWETGIIGSANLTKKGLGITDNYNYELGVHKEIGSDAILYLKGIIADGILANDEIYNLYKKELSKHAPVPKIKEPDILVHKFINDTFLISSLPMSRDINTLYEIYSKNFVCEERESLECAIHDVTLYKIPPGLSRIQFNVLLKERFFKSKFIEHLLDYIGDDGKYFGRVKEWIQTNCRDVPVPSRRDLTGNVQVLYKWIVDLSDGAYRIDRPNYSERIYRTT